MPVVDKATGNTHQITSYFQNLQKKKKARGDTVRLDIFNEEVVAVETDLIVSSMDNGFNNLESSIGPVVDNEHNLTKLYEMIDRELHDVQDALANENAMIINFSEHPNTKITPDFYYQMRAPKPIYDYWVGYRGWNHMAGIDAKAHNGPTTGVNFEQAVDALNIILGTSGAFIALYANSPFEGGILTPYKENRLTLWQRMFATSRFACDMKFQQTPPNPFKDLRDYFQWIFGSGTNMQFVASTTPVNYKMSNQMIIIQGDPPLLEFLSKPAWKGIDLHTKKEMTITPSMKHFEFLQFSHFMDARIRYEFEDPEFPVMEFLQAMEKDDQKLEELFARRSKYCYIEGRVPGANFPDKQIASLDDDDIVKSVIISASAIQKGLLDNMTETKSLLDNYGWTNLVGLRYEGIRKGLNAEYKGIKIRDLCKDCINVAGKGLSSQEHWMLTYPEYVLSSNKSGADRAIEAFENLTGSEVDRIRQLIMQREMVIS